MINPLIYESEKLPCISELMKGLYFKKILIGLRAASNERKNDFLKWLHSMSTILLVTAVPVQFENLSFPKVSTEGRSAE